MDEAARRLERRIEAEGDRLARVRLAQERLRAHDPAGALAALGPRSEAKDPDVLGLECEPRARALVALGRAEEAIEALRRAADAGAVLDPRAALALLEPLATQGPSPRRASAAAVLARLATATDRGHGPDGVAADGVPALLSTLAKDPETLVRLALVRERPRFDPHRDRTFRVYGSHGPDYETGVFVAFELSHDARLRWFEPRLAASVNAALAALADDATAIEAIRLRAAYGDGYGLGGIQQPLDGGAALVDSVSRLNALDVLPFRLRITTGDHERDVRSRPYDLMEDESRLARRLAEDLRGHPARQKAPEDATVIERIVALHPLSGIPARRELLTPLLEEAGAELTPVGLRALQIFAKLRRGETQF